MREVTRDWARSSVVYEAYERTRPRRAPDHLGPCGFRSTLAHRDCVEDARAQGPAVPSDHTFLIAGVIGAGPESLRNENAILKDEVHN